MTYKELIYMCLDEIKLASDDSYITEDHILFLIGKYRSFLLKQKYEKSNMPVAKSNFQKYMVKSNGGAVGSTSGSVPKFMNIAQPVVFTNPRGITGEDKYYTYVPFHRFKFVGNNKYLSKIKYCTIDSNDWLQLKYEINKDDGRPIPSNDTFTIWAVFEDIIAVEGGLDYLNYDHECPIESDLVAGVLELVVKDVLGMAYRPQDKANNGSDELGSVGLMSGNSKNK